MLAVVGRRHFFVKIQQRIHSSEYTAVWADRTECSTVKTTSSGSSQYCRMKAMLVVSIGLTDRVLSLTAGKQEANIVLQIPSGEVTRTTINGQTQLKQRRSRRDRFRDCRHTFQA